jgi:N-acetylmuramoyl-L-alanine amidase
MIDGWHKARGWRKIGYHYFIKKDGTVEKGRELSEIGAHVYGQNSHSVGICLAGLVDFRVEQFESLKELLRELPDLPVYGHNEFNKNKECPVFDVTPFRQEKNKWKKSSNSLWKMLLQLCKVFLQALGR